MSDVPIERVESSSSELSAEWRRNTDDDLRQVNVTQSATDRRWSWEVFVSLAEFVRDEPLESEMREAVAAAIRAVPGVTEVAEEDRELWILSGAPSGEELVRSVGAVVDLLAPRVEAVLDDLD